MTSNIQYVGSHQRLSTRNNQQAPTINFGNLINQTKAFFGGEFIMPATHLRRRVQVTMITFKITAAGEIKGDKIRLEIINGPAITRCITARSHRFEPRDGIGS
jgi:hypothetical protein